MKVLIIGGAGVFGSRLARLLVADGHDVCVAGRNVDAAARLAGEIGCRAARLDRAGDLGAGLAGFEVVVDAAGPFQAYGTDDPYRLARAALAAWAHYLDLCDDAAFCSGIAALDEQARAAGLCALSGMSSTPAISSAAVRALCGAERPDVIDVAILPGNAAPRGRSVMHAILSQAGQPMRVWRGGCWETSHGWSNPATYRLPGGTVRQAWEIEVPDVRLFPAHFQAETVRFRAGLELAVMRYGLAAFARLRRVWAFTVGTRTVRLFKAAADALTPLGTDRGGMVVNVLVGGEMRSWSLLAEAGDGPFIPAIAVRALLRRRTLPIGARPALEAITLAEAEAAMSDLRVCTERVSRPLDPIFPRVLGTTFDSLPEAIQATHRTRDISRWAGRADIARGTGLWPRLLAALFRFPPAGADVPVEVTKVVTPGGETWTRRFAGRTFRSYLAATPRGMIERFGPFAFLVDLAVKNGALCFAAREGRVGPLRLPRWLMPVATAREFVEDRRFRFDVEIQAPFTRGLIVRYRGWLEPEFCQTRP